MAFSKSSEHIMSLDLSADLENSNFMSVSPTFFEQLFCIKVNFQNAFKLLFCTIVLIYFLGAKKLAQNLLMRCW